MKYKKRPCYVVYVTLHKCERLTSPHKEEVFFNLKVAERAKKEWEKDPQVAFVEIKKELRESYTNDQNRHREMEILITTELEQKLSALDKHHRITRQTILPICADICKKIAQEKGFRYYYMSDESNLLFYEKMFCIKVNFFNNPQIQAISIGEEIIKHSTELKSDIYFC